MELPLTYKKTAGFATTEGQQLEVNLAALLFLRGLNSGLEFQLGTNVLGAGALDDLVFRFKPLPEADTWTTLFVQLKHKANRPVQRVALKNSKGDFSLPKYFESYLEIKQAMSTAVKGTLFDGTFEKSVFVLFTNTKASASLENGDRKTLCKAEEFVWCGSGKVFSFKEDNDMLDCFSNAGEEGRMFLGRLGLFCGQPNSSGLEVAIEKELRKIDSKIIQGVDLKILSDCFLRRVTVWWKKSNEVEVLHKGNDLLQASVLEIISNQIRKEHLLGIDFEEDAFELLRTSVMGDCKVVNVQSSESSFRLSLTKLCQVLGDQLLVLDSKSLLANKVALLKQWQKGDLKSIVICTDSWSSLPHVDYFNVVIDLLAIRESPPIVLLSNDESFPVGTLLSEFQESVKNHKDKFLFSQLKKASREKILAKEVSLQGHSTTLSKLLDGTPGSADRVLDACSVVEILECDGSLTVGSAFDEGIGFYVDRHLELANSVKTSVFQDGALRGNVTIRAMQCEASAILGLDKGNVSKTLGFPWGLATILETGFFENIVSFLSSLSDSTSIHNVSKEDIVRKLSQSLIDADRDNSEVLIGPKFQLGMFECNSVGLRFGQQDAVTALRVGTGKYSSQASFLFVSDKINENDAKKLCDFHQSRHLLLLNNGQLRWIQSCGDIASIRPYMDRDQVSTFAPENVMQVEDRLVLICAEPGMGKSTLMARLAKNTKEALPHYFIFLIILNDHSQLFAKGIHKDALDFLCKANKIESYSHRSMLKFALEVSGNVVILFDGYDEIAPKYVEQSCELLASLVKETKAGKIWMTSRNSIKIPLEDRISKFSLKLRKFNETDQISFLKKFWEAKSSLSETELDNFTKRLVTKTSQTVRDEEKDFMGIPLQTRMLAEVYEDHVTGSAEKTKLPDELDLLVLLEQFVDKKCGVYVQAKLKISSDDPNYETLFRSLRKSFLNSHARAALILILGIDVITNLRMESIVKKSSSFFEEIKSGSYMTGFIDSVVNGKPRFIHRVFAEYFVAKWISKYFADNRELVESEMFTADFVVVRNVFDRLLARGRVLHTATLDEDLETVRSLLEREDLDIDEKDSGGRTALHLAASRGTSKDREESKRRGEILDLLVGKTSDLNQVDDVLNGSPLKYADVTRSWVAVDKFKPSANNEEQFSLTLEDVINQGMLDTVFSLDLHNLLGFCLDNGLAVEHCTEGKRRLLSRACELGSLKVASLLIGRNADIYKFEDQYDFILHVASGNGHLDIVKLLHKHHMSTLANISTAEISIFHMLQLGNYINMTDEVGRTAIFLAAQRGHSDVISFLISQGGDPLIGDNNKITPLHAAAGLKHRGAVKVLLGALDEADRANSVNSCNNNGDSALVYGTLGGCVDCVGMLIQAGGKLTQASNDGGTPLMTVALSGNREVVKYLLDNFNAEREGMSLQVYINMGNKGGRTAIHDAALNGNSDVITLLISRGGDPQSSDAENITPLHIAAEFKHPGAVRVLLGALLKVDRASAVNSCKEFGCSVLMSGALGGSLECVDLLLRAGGKLTQANEDGLTPLMIAAQKGHQEIASYLLNKFNAERESMSKVDYINMTNKDDKTAIHIAALNDRSDVISVLIGQGGDPQSSDADNLTPLHYAAAFRHPGAVHVLLEALDEADRASAVNSCGESGYSALICGAVGGCVECVGLLIQAGGLLQSDTQITLLMLAAHEGHQEVLIYLLNNFDTEREGMSRQDYINVADKAGWTAIHLAAKYGRSDAISLLIDQGGNPLKTDGKNITPLHFAAESKHPGALRVLLGALDVADRAAAVNLRDDDGNSVLFYGALGGCVECVELIVNAGGKLTQANDAGSTSLMFAVGKNHVSVVDYLLSAFDPEREGMSKLAYVAMMDTKGQLALDFCNVECQLMMQTLLMDLVL